MLALKANRETLPQAVIAPIDEPLAGDLTDAQEQVTTEQKHGRVETRTSLPLPVDEDLPGFLQWKGRKSIGLAPSHCFRDGKEAIAVR